MLVDSLLAHFIVGLSFGLILFLLATGLSLTMGLMRIVNLSHGALYMVGAYVGFTTVEFTDNYLIGIFAGGICAGLLGLIMETGFLRRLYKRQLDQVLLTVGFLYVFTNILQWIYGPLPKFGTIPSILEGSIRIGEITLPIYRLAIIVFGILAAAGLWLFQEKTRIGAIIRAGMDNKEMTAILGINLKLVFSGVFAFGCFVAGFCGLIGAPILGIHLNLGWDALLLAVIVVMVGGAGSIQGSLVGGIIIGIVDAYGKAYFPELAHFSIYLIVIIIILAKPSGLMGRVFYVR